MVSTLDIGRCASKEAKPRRGWTRDGVPTRTLGLEREWIEGSYIDWRRERVSMKTLRLEREWIERSTSIGNKNLRRWIQDSVLARTLGLEGERIGRSHIDWRRKRAPAKTLDSEGGILNVRFTFVPCSINSYIS